MGVLLMSDAVRVLADLPVVPGVELLRVDITDTVHFPEPSDRIDYSWKGPLGFDCFEVTVIAWRRDDAAALAAAWRLGPEDCQITEQPFAVTRRCTWKGWIIGDQSAPVVCVHLATCEDITPDDVTRDSWDDDATDDTDGAAHVGVELVEVDA